VPKRKKLGRVRKKGGRAGKIEEDTVIFEDPAYKPAGGGCWGLSKEAVGERMKMGEKENLAPTAIQ